MKVINVRLAEVKVNNEMLRVGSEVASLMESISRNGLIHPISVNSRNELLAGGRRFKAMQELGWVEAPAIVIEDSTHQEQITIDENLERLDLHRAEKDRAIAARKKIYEKLHPETKHGGDRKGKGFKAQNLRVDSFAEDTAKKLGCSARSVEQSVARGERASSSVKDAYEQKQILPSQVDEIIKLPKEKQDQVLPEVIEKDLATTKEVVSKLVDSSKKKSARKITSEMANSPVQDRANEETSANVMDLSQKLIWILSESQERRFSEEAMSQLLTLQQKLGQYTLKMKAVQKFQNDSPVNSEKTA